MKVYQVNVHQDFTEDSSVKNNTLNRFDLELSTLLVTSGTREIGGLLDRVKDEGKKDIVLKRTDFK